MANKNTKWLADRYYKALQAYGEKVTGKEKVTTLKKKWQKLREKYIAKGETPPNLYKTAKEYEYENTPRNADMHTEPINKDLDEEMARQSIETFIADIDNIYRETMAYIQDHKEGQGHEGGKLASIADNRRSEIDDAYWWIKAQIEELINSGIPLTVIAQAIKDNVELDYSIAVSLSPPSDLVVEFEHTVEQLNGVMAQINTRAQELADQAERDYYGE